MINYSGIQISQTLDFSKTPITRTKSRFPHIYFTLILPPIFRTPDFSNQFSFSLKVRVIWNGTKFSITMETLAWLQDGKQHNVCQPRHQIQLFLYQHQDCERWSDPIFPLVKQLASETKIRAQLKKKTDQVWPEHVILELTKIITASRS